MNNLTKYDAARNALAMAVEVDEVKDIRDKAQAIAAYARQAKDTELVKWATEIKVRAERQAGLMLAKMPKAEGKLRNSSQSHDATTTKTLADLGITKSDSSRWQKLAAVKESDFELAVAAAKEVAGEVTTAAMLRAAKANEPEKQKPEAATPTPAPVAQVVAAIVSKAVAAPAADPDEYTELDALHDQIADLQAELAVKNMASTFTEEQTQADGLIAELRKELKTAKATMAAMASQRDMAQMENAELRKQITRQRKEMDKITGKRTA
jgi:hypothetical protein